MKIEKLPSGSYRIRQMHQGTMYTVVTKHKPTQKEATQLMAAEFEKIKRPDRMTFEDASAKYVDMKRNVLSPRTIKEYSNMCSRLSEWFVKKDIADIDQIAINKQVNELACNKAPKTVACLHGFITAVLGVYRPDLNITTHLPQKPKKEPYIPSDDDVKRILSHIKGSRFEIPIILACYGLRRSEICALKPEDIEGDIVHINKALVQNENKEWVVKVTKTTDSTRDIAIPMELADRIREQGYVCNVFPGSINSHLHLVQRKLGIEEFSLHKLRHYFASKLSSMEIPDADILKLGGWKTEHVMKTVYRHSMMAKEKETQRDIASKLSSTLFE